MNRTPREYAILCQQTYSVPEPAWTFAASTFHAILTDDGDGHIVIAIEGSKSKFDWIVDFSVYGPHWYEHPDLGKIHYAFDNTTDECLPEIIRACTGKIVHLTGHSKGGAEAELLAAKLVIAGITVDEVVTFGAPRWVGKGNTKASQWMNGIRGWAFRHFKDVVTQVPFVWWRHPMRREPIEIGTAPWWRRFCLGWMHHLPNYIASLPAGLAIGFLVLLAGCSGSYQEPGAAAYCKSHPLTGNCP